MRPTQVHISSRLHFRLQVVEVNSLHERQLLFGAEASLRFRLSASIEFRKTRRQIDGSRSRCSNFI